MKNSDVHDTMFTDQLRTSADMEGKREFADTENKRWVQDCLLDYYHGSKG
ncbi:hypothetical protein [Alicyclobacillus vulcanalis]|uniref:Uncharacterized protein n=1 Tax=Alicyclobacillus vulcanalis TaxID=252246 RepID=A0A1N7KK78_9BACL|nr:hypothetical protein [Alicyclobacillus vulcanalis]SIS61916.1 hypothetical protein SAMN05421799_1021 [Alicyclobacillus vulcanalis]